MLEENARRRGGQREAAAVELKEIRPGQAGRFIRRYDLVYRQADGKEKVYEMVSRKPVQAPADLAGGAPDGVVMILLSPDRSRVLLNREFRPAVGGVVYNFPAGLAEPGESLAAAAARELQEETGLALLRTLAVYGRSYGSVGLSNESAAVVVGIADDTAPFGGNHAPAEEIAPVWVDRVGAGAIVQSGAVTARVQLFLAMWAMGGPFGPETGR